MAFPDGWSYYADITIDNSQVDSALTNFTVIFDESFAALLTQVDGPLDADGSRASIDGGGDVRFSSDVEGTTQLACDIRKWATNNTPSNAECEVAIRVPSVSSSEDTTIYIWWGKSGATQPAVGDSYGQYDAYDANFLLACCYNNDPSAGGTPILDRTSNQTHGAAISSLQSNDLVAGKVGYGIDNQDEGIQFDDITLPATTYTVEIVQKPTNDYDDNSWDYMIQFYDGTNYWQFLRRADHASANFDNAISIHHWQGATQYSNIAKSASRYQQDTWESWAATQSGGTEECFYNGVSVSPVYTSGTANAPSGTTDVKCPHSGYNGIVSEFRVSGVVRADAWIKATYNNQFTEGFLTFGSIVDPDPPDEEVPTPAWGQEFFGGTNRSSFLQFLKDKKP